jgi:hypothetical protein
LETLLRKPDYDVIAIWFRQHHEESGDFPEPVKGAASGAAHGAGVGAGGVGGGCVEGLFSGILFLACLALMPVGAITGAIVGASGAHSESEVTRATEALRDAILMAEPDAEIQKALRGRLDEHSDQRYQFRYFYEYDDELTTAELASQGIDAVLWLEAMSPDLEVYGMIDPDAAVVLAVRGTLEGTARKDISPSITWAYRSKRRDYFKLADNDARLLREAIKRSYDEISKLIVADLFSEPSK